MPLLPALVALGEDALERRVEALLDERQREREDVLERGVQRRVVRARAEVVDVADDPGLAVVGDAEDGRDPRELAGAAEGGSS